mmetsp:Transcript_25742/g.41165  ORF Transcript_25742/g.41165 Transcript_25742/m.41165 type:complete len:449 (-) Transcript_25742:688-2034(-)
MDMLGDSTMMQRYAERTTKQAAQLAALGANRARYEEGRDQTQRDYDQKTAKANARGVLMAAEHTRREAERQQDLYDKGQAQVRLAEEFETQERHAAEERFQAEMVELEQQRQEALEAKRSREETRLVKEKQTVEWKKKTASIRREQRAQVDALRAQLDARDVKLEEHTSHVLALRLERTAISKQGRDATIAANLVRADEIEESRKQEWIRRRVDRDRHVAAIKMAENVAGKRAERERVANEKRERVFHTAVEKEKERVALIEIGLQNQRLHALQLEEQRKVEVARRALERQLVIADRRERVENVGRRKEVERTHHRENMEMTMARVTLMQETKATIVADRQLRNCQRSLVDSARRQHLTEEQRVASRERWLTSVQNQKEIFAAASAPTTPRPRSAAGGGRTPRTPSGRPRPASSRAGSTAPASPVWYQQPRSQGAPSDLEGAPSDLEA